MRHLVWTDLEKAIEVDRALEYGVNLPRHVVENDPRGIAQAIFFRITTQTLQRGESLPFMGVILSLVISPWLKAGADFGSCRGLGRVESHRGAGFCELLPE